LAIGHVHDQLGALGEVSGALRSGHGRSVALGAGGELLGAMLGAFSGIIDATLVTSDFLRGAVMAT
jgi:hypothetical protein